MDEWKNAPFPLHDIHFLAGVRGSENSGHATAKCLHVPKGYGSEPGAEDGDAASDIATIVLNDRLDIGPMRLESNELPAGTALTHAAYAADRRYALSVHAGCHVQQPDADAPLWLTDCDTHPASSGGPLMAKADGGFKLAAIMIGTTGRGANVAVPVSRWKELVRDSACP
jgi:V8-like Glu-specific endopeptidase